MSVLGQARAIGREERRAEEEQHHDEEEPALIYGICSRHAKEPSKKFFKKSNYGTPEVYLDKRLLVLTLSYAIHGRYE